MIPRRGTDNAEPTHPQKAKKEVSRITLGSIFLCAFDPTVGHEIKKTRPALVIQNDAGNRCNRVTIVAAIRSTLSPVPYPVEVPIEASHANGLTVRSAIRLDQIRSIDRQHLIRRLGAAEPAVMTRVDEALKISLGLIRF
ncbi:MAG TPA: type II toxin-antitoxin system PemK/MazF family toxin [Candidatus Limnocylindrales bacterium]|nr:type II toxin-antitoxin system PemK/MazF family toxin [Candidatus Limnocylindrales bacterium]